MTDKATLKTYFQTGDRPTQAQFAELIDSLQADSPNLTRLDGTVEQQQAALGVGVDAVVNFGADPTGTTDSTTAINAFFAYVAANNVGTAKIDGSFRVSGPLLVGPTTGLCKTLNFVGAPTFTQHSTSAAIGTLLTFRNCLRCTWDGIITIYGYGGTLLSSRVGITTGVKLQTGVNYCQFGGFFVHQTQGDGVWIDGGTECYSNEIRNVSGIDIGAGLVAGLTELTGSYSSRTDEGNSGSYDQYSEFTASVLPPVSVDSTLKGLLINGDIYTVLNVNRSTGKVQVFPWIKSTATTGSYKWLYGAALRVTGANSAGNKVNFLHATRCGYGVSVEALYGPTIESIQGQVNGAHVALGLSSNASCLSTYVEQLYCEPLTTEESYVWLRSVACDARIDVASPFDYTYVRYSSAPRYTAFAGRATVPQFSGMVGVTIGENTKQQSPNNQDEIIGAYNMPPIDRPKAVIRADAFAFYFELNTKQEAIQAQFGKNTFEVVVFGTGTNYRPTGNITFVSSGGYTLNGGSLTTINLTSSSGPLRVIGHVDCITKVISLATN